MLALLVLAIALLLLLNAFFALAEFAAVKIRSTWVEELERQGHAKAPFVRHVRDHVDEYLSVVQVGITCTSIGLGFVGEPAVARAIVQAGGLESELAHGLAIALAYVVVTFLHVVLGELVPKGIAVRSAERAALWTAVPMRAFYYAFYVPRILLHRSAHLVLALLGVREPGRHENLSEEEIRTLLGHSQARGMLSLRRLLMLENVFDLGELRVRDAMRPRERVSTLPADAPLEAFFERFLETHFSRYPLVEDGERVVGVVNGKDVLHHLALGDQPESLRGLARPVFPSSPDTPLERLFAEFQRRREQMSIVTAEDGRWLGIVTVEDALEEIVGTLGDEFEIERPVFLAELLSPADVVLDLASEDLASGVQELVARSSLDAAEFPRLGEVLRRRESMLATSIGEGVAIPHARLPNLARSRLAFGRSVRGMATDLPDQRAHHVFLVLTPAGAPGEHVRIVERIAAITESDFLLTRLIEAAEPRDVIQILREGDPSLNPE